MTKKELSAILHISRIEGTKGKCTICSAKDELRPYGDNDDNICFNCYLKRYLADEKQFK